LKGVAWFAALCAVVVVADADECNDLKDLSLCEGHSGCTWRKCDAVPSGCWSEADAARLPCDDADATTAGLPAPVLHPHPKPHGTTTTARKLVTYLMGDTKDSAKMKVWGYGQSIIIDAMLLAAESMDGMGDVMPRWVDPVLDGYLATEGSAAYNLSHHIPIDTAWIGNAVGDKIGLYPHAYLHRYLHYTASTPPHSAPPKGYNASVDLAVAKRTVDLYILQWPRHWTDGTVTRDYPGAQPSPWGPETGEHQFVWGDDAYMGLTLPSRMVAAGLDDGLGSYAQFIAKQHALFVGHLRPTASEGGGIYWHGRDAKSGAPSCCKWGRANGWTMMTHIEVLGALSASKWGGAKAALATAQQVFVDHATALAAVQNKSDGRWHQLLDNSSMWLETSSTAMFTVAMIRGVDAGWLDAGAFNPVIELAWKGLGRAIHPDGYVSGMCSGFGIHSTPADYYGCSELYGKGQPGLGSVLKAAVLYESRKAQ